MAESKLGEAVERNLIEYIDKLVQATPDNPKLAKAILYHLEFKKPRCIDLYLKEGLGVSWAEVDKTLEYLAKCNLVKLEVPVYRSEKHILEVEGVDEVKKYLESDLPYGRRTIISVTGLSDEQLLNAMNSVKHLVDFQYNKRVNLDLTKLRKIRDKSHKELERLMKKEKEKIYAEFDIDKRWETNLPSFIQRKDSTKSANDNDINVFTLRGMFTCPIDAFREGFNEAYADFPIPKEETTNPIPIIRISRRDKDDELILYNSLRYAAESTSFPHQERVEELLHRVQSRLKKALTTQGGPLQEVRLKRKYMGYT